MGPLRRHQHCRRRGPVIRHQPAADRKPGRGGAVVELSDVRDGANAAAGFAVEPGRAHSPSIGSVRNFRRRSGRLELYHDRRPIPAVSRSGPHRRSPTGKSRRLFPFRRGIGRNPRRRESPGGLCRRCGPRRRKSRARTRRQRLCRRTVCSPRPSPAALPSVDSGTGPLAKGGNEDGRR